MRVNRLMYKESKYLRKTLTQYLEKRKYKNTVHRNKTPNKHTNTGNILTKSFRVRIQNSLEICHLLTFYTIMSMTQRLS